MTLKEFIKNFDPQNPDWSGLPEEFPNCNLEELSSEEVGRFNAIKTLWELSRPEKIEVRSRVWKDPEGYRYLVPWSNAVLLRFLVRLLTSELARSEYRRKSQADDAARSVVRNIEEGYKRSTTSEYLQFIGYSQGSLEEVKGDIRELTEDGFLRTARGSSLAGVGLDLGSFHRALRGDKGRYKSSEDGRTEGNRGWYRRVKDDRTGSGNGREDSSPLKSSNRPLTSSKSGPKPWDYRPLTVLYPPLAKVRARDLTYEIFLELINKTDWNLRKLVESLERKLEGEQKYWQVEQARIKSKLTW